MRHSYSMEPEKLLKEEWLICNADHRTFLNFPGDLELSVSLLAQFRCFHTTFVLILIQVFFFFFGLSDFKYYKL